MEPQVEQKEKGPGNGKRWVGLILLAVGAVLVLRQSGYPMPEWLFRWETIVIIVGLCIGIKKGFRDLSWVIIVLVGVVFLSNDIWPSLNLGNYIFPLIVIGMGLVFILSPRRSFSHEELRRRPLANRACFRDRKRPGDRSGYNFSAPGEELSGDFLDITAVFGAVKKKVLSKTFSGGDVVCVFGGSEIDLMNADFQSPILLDCVQIFGGTKLIIPPNWEVRTDATTIFGSIEDKRPPNPDPVPAKTIVIDGTMFFGGIEIKSF